MTRRTSKRRHQGRTANPYTDLVKLGQPAPRIKPGPLVVRAKGKGRICPACGLRIKTTSAGKLWHHDPHGYQVVATLGRWPCPGDEVPPPD